MNKGKRVALIKHRQKRKRLKERRAQARLQPKK